MREDTTGRKSGFFYRELHDKSLRIGAQEKTRTSTTIQLPAPEASVSLLYFNNLAQIILGKSAQACIIFRYFDHFF